MTRLLAGLAGAVLLLAPGFFLLTTLVPVPEYRTGTLADYAAALASCSTIYGGVAIGIAVAAWRRAPARLSAGPVVTAGFLGGVLATGAVIAGQTLARVAAGDAFDPGGLWGLVVIFGAAFSVMVAGGAALAGYALGTWTPSG